MFVKRYLIFLVLIFLFAEISNVLSAQDVKILRGEYSYVVPKNVSREDAEKTAVKRARIKAIADAFGTIVSQNNFTRIENNNSVTDMRFLSLMNSEEKGVWLSDITPPKTEVIYDPKTDVMVVYAYVHGKARELVSHKTDLAIKVLRNGTDKRYESDVFINGDRFYLSFRSPEDGYVAAYLIDESDSAYCLLPYSKIKNGNIAIKANNEYVFFSKDIKHVQPPIKKENVTNLILLTSKKEEINVLYVIFSTKPFVKANDNKEKRTISGLELPRCLPFEKFQKWLTSNCYKDKSMQVEKKIIKILNNN